MDDKEYYEADEEYHEYPIYFLDCTCEHEPNEHGWMHCNVEGCECEGHYEE
jgi:hypothetical protein